MTKNGHIINARKIERRSRRRKKELDGDDDDSFNILGFSFTQVIFKYSIKYGFILVTYQDLVI